jgi:hypothetical protein
MGAHNMVGQRCAASPPDGKGRCSNLATWVYFSADTEQEESVRFTFLCNECVRPDERHEDCPASCFA